MKLSYVLALFGWVNVVSITWLAVFGVVGVESWPAYVLFLTVAIVASFAHGAKR